MIHHFLLFLDVRRWFRSPPKVVDGATGCVGGAGGDYTVTASATSHLATLDFDAPMVAAI